MDGSLSPLFPSDRIIQVSDDIDAVFGDVCAKTGLGKKRAFEVAIFLLADRLDAKDPAAFEAVETWKKARGTLEIAEDAIEVAKLRG